MNIKQIAISVWEIRDDDHNMRFILYINGAIQNTEQAVLRFFMGLEDEKK